MTRTAKRTTVGYISGCSVREFRNGKFGKTKYVFSSNYGPLHQVRKNKYKYERVFRIVDSK